MSEKPIIGLNCDFRPLAKDSPQVQWLPAGYMDAVETSGGIPTLIPLLSDDADLRKVLQQMDGLIMTGCKLDMDPVRLGLDKHPAVRVMPERRENFDRRLARIAYELKIPVLAIGSGMQTMNVMCGGSLFQHIPEDCPKALPHRDPTEKNLRHLLEVVPGTRLDNIYGPGEIRVNSDHHMAVECVADCFKVSGRCPDGVIEAYESTDENWFCVGVQFHPESESASALDLQVVEALVNAAKGVAPVILPMSRRRAA